MTFSRIIAAAMFAAAFGSYAQTAPAPTEAPRVDGEVRRIDKAQGKLTLRHGPIANLDMGSMTMVFRVMEPTMLDSLQEGDKVKFTADKVKGLITVTWIQVAD